MSEEKVYQCPECGLHYTDEQTAKDCEAFCKANHACSLEISQKSVEAQSRKEEAKDES